MKFLITGFEAFLSRKRNPSMEVLPLIEKACQTFEIKTLVLPVVFDEVFEQVKHEIDVFQPDVVLHLGLAENRNKIALERVAINVSDARGADNKGQMPSDEQIIKTGENAYFSTIPLRQYEQALLKEGIPAYISNSTGTYVCNNLLYHTLHYAKTMQLDNLQAGFIHLPLMKEQAPNDLLAMPLNKIKDAIIAIIMSYKEVD